MDRRQQKTRAAIIIAFNELLAKKNYKAITIQEIIDKANIGRSTFYAHFETKDMLLISICTEIFEHIFLEKLPEQINLNANEQTKTLTLQLTHILFHLKDSQIDTRNILKSEGQNIFLSQYKEYIKQIMLSYLKSENHSVPAEYLLHFLTESFISTTSWWILTKSNYTPDEMANYYIKTIKANLKE